MKKVRIRPQHRKEMEHLLLLKQHHQMLAAASEQQLIQLLKTGYDVDITGQDWTLDLEKGTLTREQG
jgi:CYTH domain-containing protein